MTIRKVDAYGASLGANTFTGAMTLPNGTAALPALNIGGNNKGFYGSVHDTIGVADGTARWSFGLTAIVLNIGYNFGWGTVPSALDTNLSRISAGIIGVGTGAVGNVAGGLQAATLTLGGVLTVPGVTTAALTSTGTFTSGAGAQVGTLTNAPAAGNPTTWIKIVDNGVTRFIPAW